MRAGRLPAPSGDLRSDAMGELRWSMAGAGLTIDKVPLMRSVMRLPFVVLALEGVSAESRPRVALETIIAAARGLGDGVRGRAVRSSLAIDYHGDGKDLTARRVEFIRDHNEAVRSSGSRSYLGESPRALYDVEQEMLAAMVTALGAPADAGEAVAGAEASVAAWACADFDITYRLRGREGVEAESVHVVRALTDGVNEMNLAYGCGTDEGGAGWFTLLEGGTVVDDRCVGRPGFRSARIRYPRALKVGETHRVRFDVRYPPSPSPDSYYTIQVVRPTDHVTIRVTFDPCELPCRVWRVDGLLAEVRGGDPDESEPLEPDVTGCVSTSFTSPPPSFCYGIAWAW